LRPDVVLFGEHLPDEAFEASRQAARRCDVCLLLGTSGIVHPAAGLPREAAGHGATLVEINPNETELSALCDVVVRKKTGKALPEIVEPLIEEA
jgi:NAD-dependent deacetylase